MIKKHKILSVIAIMFVLLFVNLVNANGLTLINGTDYIQVNKTAGIDKDIELVLISEEGFSFFDIEFENNNIITMQKIDELTSGDTIYINATITTDQDFTETVRMKGFYNASGFSSNEVHLVNIDFYADVGEEISPCSLSIYKGETVKWNNICDMEIQLINTYSHELITTIAANSNYSLPFPTQMTLNYCLGYSGSCFTSSCQVSVLSDTSFVNNPTFDAILSLNIDVIHLLTNILVSTTIIDYEIEAGSSVENQILFVQNNGNNIAKSIFLSGDWFSFDENYFDLEPGDHKYVEYKIEPHITNINETNKHYIQNISVVGNFETIIQSINIFIPYEENIIEDDYSDLDWKGKLEEYAELVRAFCNTYPDDSICDIITKNIITGSANGTDGGFSLSFIKSLISFMDRMDKENNLAKEDRNNLRIVISSDSNRSIQTSEDVADLKKDMSGYNSGVILLVMLLVTIAICAFLYYILIHLKRKKQTDEMEKFY